MSDAGQERREWRFYVDDMIGFAEKVQSFTDGMDQDTFVSDALTYDATLRNLELIGEAAAHIPGAIRETYPEIPWRTMVSTRNRIAHGYMGIDDDIIWDIIQNDIPVLLLALRRIAEGTESVD